MIDKIKTKEIILSIDIDLANIDAMLHAIEKHIEVLKKDYTDLLIEVSKDGEKN